MKVKKFETPDGDIELVILGNKESEEKIMITAGKHGDEPEGVYIIENFIVPYLKKNDFEKCFVIFPNLNPNQIRNCLGALSRGSLRRYDDIRAFRLTESGVNLNADYPTQFKDAGDVFLQAKQTQCVIDVVNEYKCSLILDIHTNGQSPVGIYKYDEAIGEALAKEMGSLTGTRARDYVHHKNKGRILSGTSGTYFGKERNIPILTIELGRASYKEDFFIHCENLWKRHKPAFDYLFQPYRKN